MTPEGKSIAFKTVPGIVGLRLFPNRELQFGDLPSSRHNLHKEWEAPRCLPRVHALPRLCTEYPECQNSRAKHPRGPAGSVWAFFPDQLSRGWNQPAPLVHYWCTTAGCLKDAWGFDVHADQSRCMCRRLLTMLAGLRWRTCKEIERTGHLHWFSCPRPRNYRGRCATT